MLAPLCFLAAMGLLGAFDIFYFHRRCRLAHRPASRVEAALHVARGLIYTAQFALVPNVRCAGAWYAAFLALFGIDVAIAIADVVVEPSARRALGGLTGGEYLAHIVLSIFAGAYLYGTIAATLPWARQATALSLAPAALPAPLRLLLAALAIGCALVTLLELLEIVDALLGAPRPVHVSVRLAAPRAQVWAVTQDPLFHPEWDHRFSRIIMLGDEIRTGTRMRYEKQLLGLTIQGFGRYKLHRPERQSTFEFWSDDPRSLIRRGVGLWRYTDAAGGTLFTTSYTYEVRWGVLGRLLDRGLFRRLFQQETERSFARLARLRFAAGASPVAGAAGRKPARLAA